MTAPFALTDVGSLCDLGAPANPQLVLAQLGGVEGILRTLDVDPSRGIDTISVGTRAARWGENVIPSNPAASQRPNDPPTEYHVLRDGRATHVLQSQLVVGDIILFRPGDVVPADCIVISGELYVDQSQMTGEGRPLCKTLDSVPGVLCGSLVTAVTARDDRGVRALVLAVGKDTNVAQWNSLLRPHRESRCRCFVRCYCCC